MQTPVLAMIAAMDKNRVIGVDNTLPWRLSGDMKWFVQNTKGKPVLVGRKTFESFGSKALKERPTIVITRDQHYQGNDAIVAHSIDEGLQLARQNLGSTGEIMVIGGATFYQQLLPQASKLYLTEVAAEVKGDAQFPQLDMAQWREVFSESHGADDKNEYDYTFRIYERV